MIIDVHCHYTLSAQRADGIERFSFEELDDSPAFDALERARGVEECPRPTAYDACVSPRASRSFVFRLLRSVLKLPGRGAPPAETDAALAATWLKHLDAPGRIERYVLLAFDAFHDDAGELTRLPVRGRDPGNDIYTSNSLIRDLCRRRPDRFLFGASVHPYRERALKNMEEVVAAGACLLKWLPVHHNIDARDPRTIAALRHCRALGLPVLVHYNEEFTLASNRPRQLALAPFLQTLHELRRRGDLPTVILAHVATPVTPLGTRRWFEMACSALAGDFANAPLYADISALTAFGKIPFLRRLVRRQDLHRKLLFGSDFPIPIATMRLWRDLGSSYRRIAAIESWPQRAAEICAVLGFNETVFTRAAELLPSVRFFARE